MESFFVELSVTVCLFTLPVNYTLFIFLVCSRVAFCQPSIKPKLRLRLSFTMASKFYIGSSISKSKSCAVTEKAVVLTA